MNFPAGIDRPLSIAEIVDRSVTLAVQRWRVLLLLVLAEAVPIGIVRMLVPERPAVLMLVWWVPDVAVVALLYGAASLATAAPNEPSAGAVLRTSARRYGSLLAAFTISWLYVVLILLAIVLAAFAAMVLFALTQNRIVIVAAGGTVAVAGFILFFPRAALIAMIVMPIVALEDVSPWQGVRTAFRRLRTAGRWRAWLLGLAAFAMSAAPALLISIGLDTAAPNLPGLKLIEELLADTISLGAGMVVATVIAVELRVRYEGSDLAQIVAQTE